MTKLNCRVYNGTDKVLDLNVGYFYCMVSPKSIYSYILTIDKFDYEDIEEMLADYKYTLNHLEHTVGLGGSNIVYLDVYISEHRPQYNTPLGRILRGIED